MKGRAKIATANQTWWSKIDNIRAENNYPVSMRWKILRLLQFVWKVHFLPKKIEFFYSVYFSINLEWIFLFNSGLRLDVVCII